MGFLDFNTEITGKGKGGREEREREGKERTGAREGG